jgi:hypothetical protein
MTTLPNMRPTSETYGPDLINDRAIVDDERELDAASWNLAKEDLAYCAGVVPIAVLKVDHSGGGTSISTAKGIPSGQFTVTPNGTGDVTIARASGSWLIDSAQVTALSSTPKICAVELVSTTSVRVRITDHANAAAYSNFTLALW